MLRSYYKKLPPNDISYRNFTKFEKMRLRGLDSRPIQCELYNNCQEQYEKLTQIFSEALDYHAPVKQKIVRGNQAPFMTKDSKAIMMLSKAKNQYIKWPSGEHFLAFRKAKNKFTSIN